MARRGLQARQLLSLDDKKVNPLAAAAAGATVGADRALLLLRKSTEAAAEPTTLYALDDFTILHAVNDDSMHTFRLILEKTDLHTAVSELLDLDTNKHTLAYPPATIPVEQLDKLLDAATNDEQQKVVNLLAGLALEDETRHALAATLTAQPVIYAIAPMTGGNEDNSKALTLLHGEGGAWLGRRTNRNGAAVILSPTTTPDATQAVLSLFS